MQTILRSTARISYNLASLTVPSLSVWELRPQISAIAALVGRGVAAITDHYQIVIILLLPKTDVTSNLLILDILPVPDVFIRVTRVLRHRKVLPSSLSVST